MNTIRLPIGIQDFEKLREDGFFYIDKTRYIYELVHGEGTAYFLSRPRRFGKSLFLSALKAYFEGKRELFAGLEIEELERDNQKAWQRYPVFYFDFNKDNFREKRTLEQIIEEHLGKWEHEYGVFPAEKATLAMRFRSLLEKAYETIGRRAVILVDEYDKPLLENGGGYERTEHDRYVYKGFFSTLKRYDEYDYKIRSI